MVICLDVFHPESVTLLVMADQAEKEVCARDKLLAAERLPALTRQAAIAKVVEDCQVPAALCSDFLVCRSAPSFFCSFLSSFMPSFILSLLHSCLPSFTCLHMPSFLHSYAFLPSSFLPSFLPSFLHSFIHPSIHPIMQSRLHACPHLGHHESCAVIHSLFLSLHSVFHLSTHSFVHSFIIQFFIQSSLNSIIHSLNTCVPLGLSARSPMQPPSLHPPFCFDRDMHHS